MTVRAWLRRVDWLWMIIGGFYLVAYLYWYIPVLKELPGSLTDPPKPYPWHWTLDLAATGIAGAILLYLGFGRATDSTPAPSGEESTEGDASTG